MDIIANLYYYFGGGICGVLCVLGFLFISMNVISTIILFFCDICREKPKTLEEMVAEERAKNNE